MTPARRTRSRLRLHRETLRTLDSGQLDRIAGGTGEQDPATHEEPKTNAWTAGWIPIALCGGGAVM